MTTPAKRLTPFAALLLLVIPTTGGPSDGVLADRAMDDMVSAAQAFVSMLDPAQRERAVYRFDDDERYDWHFVPRDRTGLPFRDMTPEQRRAGHALLQTAVSAAGYLKATGVMHLEQILGVMENRPERRDPEAYFFWIFGTPSADEPWGWRFEGHHLSINFTSATRQIVATPTFLGANPATVPTGPFTGMRVLGAEEDQARALARSLDASQRRRAILADTAPRDIVTGAERRVQLDGMAGLPVREMTPGQQTAVRRLLMEYVGNMQPEIAGRQMEKIDSAGFGNLHFAWAGSLEPGQPHYYRIHGPTVLVEYDNTQNDANHVHSVWRDPTDDFGEDLLRRHYREADHHQEQ